MGKYVISMQSTSLSPLFLVIVTWRHFYTKAVKDNKSHKKEHSGEHLLSFSLFSKYDLCNNLDIPNFQTFGRPV